MRTSVQEPLHQPQYQEPYLIHASKKLPLDPPALFALTSIHIPPPPHLLTLLVLNLGSRILTRYLAILNSYVNP